MSSRSLAVTSLAVAALILAAYSNHFHNGFHFDDAHTIVNNAFIRSPANIGRFFTDATTFSALPQNQSYRPIVSMTLAVDYWLGGGLKPFWFQLSNFTWFLLQTVLLGLMVHVLLDRRHPHLALGAAALYGVLPANADTVNYIIARSDILSTLGIVAGFAIYLLMPRARNWQLHLVPVAIAILAKPIAAIYAPLFALLLLLFPQPEQPQQPNHRWEKPLSAALAFILCALLSILDWKMTPKTWTGGAANAAQYFATQPYVTLLYFKTFFWPAALSADYDLTPLTGAGEARLWAGVLFTQLLLAGGVVAACYRKTRVIGFGLLWFLIALLPTALSPLAEVMNDHRTFLPYIGLVIALAGAAALIPARAAGLLAGTAIFALSVSAFGTYQRNKVWKDDESLWHDVVLKGPGNGRALMNHGAALMAEGRMPEAYTAFQHARDLVPYYPILYVNLAVAEAAMGNPAQAERDFQTALRLGPQYPDCNTFYARFLFDRGRSAEAGALLRQALALSPGDLTANELLDKLSSPPATAENYLQISLTEFRAAHYPQSIAAAQKALALRPDYAEAYNNIGAAWNALGRYDLAATACQQALRLKPAFPLARNNLLYALQMSHQLKLPPPHNP